MKIFPNKTTAILTVACFIFSGIPMPASFAAVNELILNEAQQPVPTITLEQANAQTTVTQDAIPSGVAVQNSNPLSPASATSTELLQSDSPSPVSVIENGDFLQKSTGNTMPDGWAQFWATTQSVPGYLASYDGKTGVVDLSLSTGGRGMKQTYSRPITLDRFSQFDITFKIVSATLTGDGSYGTEAPVVFRANVTRTNGSTYQVTRYFNYTNDANSASNPNFILVAQNQWVTRSLTAQELGLAAGDKLTEIDVYSAGWNRTSYVDSVSLYLNQVPPVAISFSGVESQLAFGTDMTVTAVTNPSTVDAYQWYLDGALISGATTASVTVGNSLATGDHALTVETTLGGVVTSNSAPFTVIDFSQYLQLDISDQYAPATTVHLTQDIDTFTHSYWDPSTGTTIIQYYPITTTAYNYGTALQLSRSYAAWNPSTGQTHGHTYEDRAIVEFDLSRWYQMGFSLDRITRVELLATVTGSGASFQGYDFSINSMQALEDGLFSSAQNDFNVGMTGLRTMNSLQLNATPLDLRFNITDLLLNDFAAQAAWSGIVFKSEAANLPLMQLANLRLKVYYDTDPTIPPGQPVVTSTVPAVTNQTTLTLSGTKEANTSIWINGAEVVALDNLTTWTATVNLATEGNNPIDIKAKNSNGLESTVKALTVLRDTVLPTGSININSGTVYSTSLTLTLNLSATDSSSGIHAMSFSSDNVNWTTPEAYAASKSFALSAGDGTKTVRVKYYDKAGNVSAIYSKSIVLDTMPPTGVITINSGAAYTALTAVTLNLSFSDGTSGITTMSFSTNGTTWTTPETYAASKAFTIATGDGPKTVYIKCYDKAGNVSQPFSSSIILDTLPPSGTIKVNGGAKFINKNAVTLNLSATDAGSGLSKMRFSTDGTTWTTAETYAASRAWTFPAGDGLKRVYVKFQDKSGKWSAATSVAVTLDTVRPTGSININSGAVYASSQTVTLNLSATDSRTGVNTMSFSTNGVSWMAPVAYAVSKAFALPAGDGVKRVYVKYYDKAGHVSATYSKTIILDTLPPTGTIKINGGVQFIKQAAVTLNLAAADAGSGLSQMSFSTNGTTWTTAEAYAVSRAWTFSSGDGNKTVYVKFLDKSGKWSTPGSVTVLLDTVIPTGSIAINSGALYTNSTAVTLNLLAADAASGMNSMSFSIDNVNWTATEAYAASRAFTLAAGDGKKTIYVKYYDKAGNVSAVVSKSIILDTVAPAVVLDAGTPSLIREMTLTVSYTADGVAKTKLFEGLVEGENTLAITEQDLAGNQTVVNWVVTVETVAWIPAASNANYAFRVIQNSSGHRLELRYNPTGGITILSTGTGNIPDTFDVTPDGSKVIYEGGGTARVERIGEPWTARTVEGDLTQILYYNDYVMLKTDRTYPSGTVIRTSTGIRISTFNPEFISTFYLTLVTPGTSFYRNDALSLAVQPEYDQTSGQYYALIYRLYGGNDYSSSVSSVSLGQEAPETAGGTFTLVDAVVAPNGETVLAIGLDSPTFNKTFLINQNITFDGAATAVTYQNDFAIYTVRDNDGTVRTVRFDLDKLEIVPEIPVIELVQPVITQIPDAANQWTLKLDQAMRGVLYEIQFDAGSGVWQTAGTFIADNYGEVSWQDPEQDRGAVVYRAVPKEITTAADLLTQINMLYFDTDFGLTEATHEYPLEAWLQRRITQPSNFGFYANLLATIAAGDLVTSTISKTEAIRKLDAMMTHLLEDQQTLGYKGLLPWLGYYNGDWQRMDDLYGRQVSFEDNTNMTNGLGVAYGALLDASLAGNATVHAQGGILEKIDTFIENQREGYVAMYNNTNQTFARTMVIEDGRLEGTVDLFGAESSGTLLFLILQYGDAFPASAYQKLNFSTQTYTMQDGTTREVVAPFSGAFQMYWPALLMPEAENPDLRAMLETYTDVQLDFAQRNNQPGILSASYDVGSHDLLSRYINAFSWQGDSVSSSRGADGSYHLTAGSANGIGVAFTDDSKYTFEGSSMQLQYSSQTAVPNARLEFKQKIDGVLQVVHTEILNLENTGGEIRTVSFQLPENGVLGDLTEVVFVTSDGAGALDVTFYSIDADRIAYNFSLGINEIAQNGVSETSPSVYNLGAAYMFRPAGVETLLQKLIDDHPDLITDHGLWEGKNMSSGKVVKEQVFNNVLSFILGMTGTGSSSMTRYLENKGLMTELESIWDPQTPVSLTDKSASSNFEWNGFKGTSWRLPESVRASDRELRIAYQSTKSIQGVKIELKHANSNEAGYSVQFDLPATGSAPEEFVLTVPESILYWYIAEAVVLFPETQGFPNATITSMNLAPAEGDLRPVVVVDAATPHVINVKTLAVSYTVDGVAKTKIFEGLVEGANTLTITETNLAGNQTVVNWDITVDTIAPAVVLNSKNPSVINTTSVVFYYTVDGVSKDRVFNALSSGVNTLTVTETDLAGNQTTVNLSVLVDLTAHDFLSDPLAIFAFDGGNVSSSWGTDNLHVASTNLQGLGISAITPGIDVVGKQLQFRYSSAIQSSKSVKIEFKKRDAFGILRVVGTRYFYLENTYGEVRTVDLGIIPPGIPDDLDEVTFVAQGSGESFDISIYGFMLYKPA